MGQWLDICNKNGEITKNIFCGTKLYGYKEENKFKSFKYLVGLGKIDIYARFGGGHYYEIELTKDEFTKFIKLYAEDFKKAWDYDEDFDLLKERPDLNDCLNYQGTFIIGWV